ncbi:MAG: winged helix-turn-helix transcriptional regulator [Ruminococcaceae bacterium]|nr:winged helix-turn-helix transcriptional regulator [Oscillospiraceae bacterium]
MDTKENISDELVRLLQRTGAMFRRMRPPADDGAKKECGKGKCDPRRHAGKGRIINIIREHGEIPQTNLAQMLGIRPQSLSEAVMRLCEEGIVKKTRSEYDGRVTILSLTEYGLECSAKMQEGRLALAEEFMSPLSNEEKEELKALLTKLIEAKGDEAQ